MFTAIRGFIATNKLAVYAGLALVLALLLLTTYCQGRTDGKTGEVVGQQKREIKTQEKVGAANTSAADTRVNDAVRSEQQQKELNDALEATSDPDRQRALRGCVILRQQGRDTSRIPACSGPEGERRAGLS